MFNEEEDRRQSKHVYNGVDLRIDHSFGCLSLNIEKNGMFISEDDQSIVYPSGDHLVNYNLSTKNSEFITREKSHMGMITAITTGLTKQREVIIGIAERDMTDTPTSPVVSIYLSERQNWIYCEHDEVPGLNESSFIKQVIIPDFSRYCITLVSTEGQDPFVTYFRYERQQSHRKGSISPKVNKIAVNPFILHSFIAIGNEYCRNYLANDKSFIEAKDAIIPNKYEKDNNFTDIKFFPDSHAFVLVSSQRNIFIIEGKTVVFIRYDQSSSLVAEMTSNTDILEIDSEKANKEIEAEMEIQKSLFEKYKDTDMGLMIETHKKGFVVGTQHKLGFFNIYSINKDLEVTLIQSF